MPSRTVPGKSDRPLPPPGDARREELSRRTDELEEQAGSMEGAGAINPESLRVENELASKFNLLDVSNADPMYQYSWVNYINQHGLFVKMKLSEGWEVVRADMLECAELVQADTTRKLGDVLLMRITYDRYKRIENQRREAVRRQNAAVTQDLRDLGDKVAGTGVIVHTDKIPDHTMKAMQSRAEASRIAGRKFDGMVREGNVPGMPGPGSERR